MRICVVYDCLFPYTVGGAERWYRNLALRLRDDGHEVTFVTLRQWDRGTFDDLPGITVVTAGPRMGLYTGDRRRILPPLVFGAGVLWHLLRHGRRYDVVHTASFPYFSLLAAGMVRPVHRYRLTVDWHEVWSRGYWRDYLGRIGGAIGYGVQLLCARIPQRAYAFSRLHAGRLRDEGLRGEVTVLSGEYEGADRAADPVAAEPVVVFAGRLIPEKRAPAVVGAVVAAAQSIPGLSGVVFGDGLQRGAVQAEIARLSAGEAVSAPGFVDSAVVDDALRSALCMILPSTREGYGMIVVESAAVGTPSIVVREPDNAAVELIEDDVNGVVATSAAADDLAAAIVRIHEGGDALRHRTADWYTANARRLSLAGSLQTVLAGYAAESARR
jgi:glycosyltransferase involved in cell wall biosynthesis